MISRGGSRSIFTLYAGACNKGEGYEAKRIDLSSPEAYFGPNGDLALIPQVWLGGLGIWGGIAGGVLAGVLLLRHRGLRVAPPADAAAPAPRCS